MLAGRVGEAIQVTQQLYPGLLEHNPNLLFVLKLVNMIFKTSITNAVVLPQTFIRSAESLPVSGVAMAITALCFAPKVSSVCGDGERHGWRGVLPERPLAEVPGALPWPPQSPPRTLKHTFTHHR